MDTLPNASAAGPGGSKEEPPFEGYVAPRTPPYEGNLEGALDPDAPAGPRSPLLWTASGIALPRSEEAGWRFRATLGRFAIAAVVTVALVFLWRSATRDEVPVATLPAPILLGSLWVETQPGSAQVELDGDVVGRTPLGLRDLRTGTHTLRLSIDAHEPIETTVEIRAHRETTVNRALYRGESGGRGTGTLDLQSTPRAEVFFEGESLGHTPLTNVALPTGIVRLELVTEDGERHPRGVVIHRDDSVSTHIVLNAATPGTPNPP